MAYNPLNPNGQATSASSSPVVLPADYASTTSSKITDGTNAANVLAGDTGYNGEVMAGGVVTIPFTTSTTGAQIILPNTNVKGYSWIEVVYTSVGAGLALSAQFAPTSGGTYMGANTFSSSVAGATPAAIGVTNNIIYFSGIRGNFFQLNVTALTSGTFAGTVTLRAYPPGYSTMSVTSSATAGVATPTNLFPLGGNNTANNLTSFAVGSGQGDANAVTGFFPSTLFAFNGTTWDRMRSAVAANGTTGTGLLGAGSMSLGKTANPTAVTDGQQVEALADKLGKQVVVGSIRDLKADAALTLTSTTTETTLIAAIAATFIDVFAVICTNTSSTPCEVIFRDVTAGTPRFSINVPANDTRSITLNESAAYKQATVNTAWTAQCVTSVASIKINAAYVKNI